MLRAKHRVCKSIDLEREYFKSNISVLSYQAGNNVYFQKAIKPDTYEIGIKNGGYYISN